jgi:hypothetical protein
MNMLQLVSMGNKQIDEGRTRKPDDVFTAIENKLETLRENTNSIS